VVAAWSFTWIELTGLLYPFLSKAFANAFAHYFSVELSKTLAHLIRTFDFQLADPMQGVQRKVYGVYVQKGMNVIARPRSMSR
jgi:hypothetical protein